MTEHDAHAIQVPLSDFVTQVAKEAARTVIQEHLETKHADLAKQIPDLYEKINGLTAKMWFMIGLAAGSGGLSGAIVAKLLSH